MQPEDKGTLPKSSTAYTLSYKAHVTHLSVKGMEIENHTKVIVFYVIS